MKISVAFIFAFVPLLFPATAIAGIEIPPHLDLTLHPIGYLAITIFVIGYLLVILEEVIGMRKSKPMMLSAAVIWTAIAVVYALNHNSQVVADALNGVMLDYGQLLLFLIVSITYLNAMEERMVFEAVRGWLVNLGVSYRKLFWITGIMAFFISSVSNNMTAAMLMTAVVLAVGKDNPRFVLLCCINTIVAVNAGGAYCPFGDITTLIVWQKHKVEFAQFFYLFIPAALNFVVPAAIMHFSIPNGQPLALTSHIKARRGAWVIVGLLLTTVATSALLSSYLDLPPTFGMMVGLTFLQFYGFYLRKTHADEPSLAAELMDSQPSKRDTPLVAEEEQSFDVFHKLAKMEWDTLLFFYGVMVSVGGLKFIGFLDRAALFLYSDSMSHSLANILVGLVSAFIDNSTVMIAILSMNHEQSLGQWLLVTLTAGVGGSLLSFGSAAGVALMGQAKGIYTFKEHLKWTPVILLGYIASVAGHLIFNERLF